MSHHDILPFLKGPPGNGGPPPGGLPPMQFVQPVNNIQFLANLSVMLPDFEVLHPAYVDPGHGEMVDASGCPKMMPATLEHRLGRALEHVENVVYLLQLGELRHAEERGVARAKALEQERLEAERQRQAEQDTKKVGRSVET